MIQITPQHRLLIYPHSVDFRKGIDKLIGFCRANFEDNPFAGILFCFRNTAMTAIKVLVYDGTGFWLCHKRFSKGKIMQWPKTQQEAYKISAVELQVILNQGHATRLAPSWHALPSSKT